MLNKKPRIFLDTNVLLDLLFNREPFSNDAKTYFWLLEQKRADILLSATSFINADYVCKHYSYSHVQFRQILKQIEPLVKVTPFDQKDIHKALNSDIQDFEDATQIYSAIHGKADVIITRNTKDFINSPIPCFTPTEFLQNNPHLLN